MKQDFYSFSRKISKKQESLSTKHKVMNEEHIQFKNKINKRMNSYSK